MSEDRKTNSIKERIYQIIMIGYTGDVPSRIFDLVIAAAILLNLFIIFFETFDVSAAYIESLNVLEFITVVIFTIEYGLRLLTADLAYPDKKSFAASVVAFVFSLYGIIDLLSFLPYWLQMIFPVSMVPVGMVAFRMLRVVRILRLFRINRYYDAFNVITDVIREKKNQIASAVFIILMLVLGASIIMYNLEHNAQPEAFKNAFSGIWWAVSTLLTVGYGDIYPVTAAGRFVGIILAFLGVGIVAIPTGIISAGFVEQYTKVKDLEGTIEEYPIEHITVKVTPGHVWAQMRVSGLELVSGVSVAAIINKKGITVPAEDTVICENDRVVLIGGAVHEKETELMEVVIDSRSERIAANVEQLERSLGVTCLVINRNGNKHSAKSDTVLQRGDVLTVIRRSDTGGRM